MKRVSLEAHIAVCIFIVYLNDICDIKSSNMPPLYAQPSLGIPDHSLSRTSGPSDRFEHRHGYV
ncbi:hypothetical protein TMatcc_009794 [Talaromyces marneffei ATCC 18224]